MNVVMLLSNAFTHDSRVYAEAQSLLKAGYDVTVVALDKERKHPAKSVLNGISIERVRPLPILRSNKLMRPLTLVWGGLNLLFSQWQMYRRALKLHRRENFSIIHSHDLDTLLAGVALKRKTRLPLIYDAHEVYGYMLARRLPNWIASRFLWLEKKLIRYVNHVISVDEIQKTYLDAITDKPITLVMNCKPLQLNHYHAPSNEIFTVLYIGGLHKGRSVTLLIDAVGEIDGVRCVIGGIGSPKEVQVIADRCAATRNAQFIGKVPMHDVIPLTCKADVVALILNPSDLNNRDSLANKQFEAMVCGRPIICTKGTYSGNLTEQEKVGLTVEHNKEALKEAIVRLRDDCGLREQLGRNALLAALTKYNWEKEEQALLEIYRVHTAPGS
jgi:glycosyltransferase involved in cell wall biosynthesis